jgi:hypothetical protein
MSLLEIGVWFLACHRVEDAVAALRPLTPLCTCVVAN